MGQTLSASEPLFSRSISPNELGEGYASFLDPIREILKGIGVDVRRRRSIRDIVIEYLANIDLHQKEVKAASRIELRRQDDTILVEMKGTATPHDLTRMKELVRLCSSRDEDWLWSEWEKVTRAGKSRDSDGSGLGILTVAALSRRGDLTISTEERGSLPQFTLTSRV